MVDEDLESWSIRENLEEESVRDIEGLRVEDGLVRLGEWECLVREVVGQQSSRSVRLTVGDKPEDDISGSEELLVYFQVDFGEFRDALGYCGSGLELVDFFE